MPHKFYQIFAYAVVCTIASFSCLEGNEKTPSEEDLKGILAENAYNHMAISCAPGRPYIEGERFFGELDILYWHARVDDTAFGYKSERPLGVSPIQGPTFNLNWGWDFGFKIGAGYNLSFDGFNLLFNYLHFSTSKTTSAYGSTISPFIPIKSVYLINQSVTQAQSNGSLGINSLDFLLSRETFLSPYFVFSPYAGLKNSWLLFKQKTSYSGGAFLDVNSVYVTDKTHFWGIGPKIGSNMKWFIGNGFNILGNLAFSFQYGIFKNTYEDRMSQIPSNKIHLTDQSHQFAPLAEFALGMGWGTYVNQCKQFIDIALSYEGEYWFNQNQTLRVENAQVSRFENVGGDISVHGATLTVRVNF